MTIKAPESQQRAARDLEAALAYWNRYPGTARAVRVLISALEAYRREHPGGQEAINGPPTAQELDCLAA